MFTSTEFAVARGSGARALLGLLVAKARWSDPTWSAGAGKRTRSLAWSAGAGKCTRSLAWSAGAGKRTRSITWSADEGTLNESG